MTVTDVKTSTSGSVLEPADLPPAPSAGTTHDQAVGTGQWDSRFAPPATIARLVKPLPTSYGTESSVESSSGVRAYIWARAQDLRPPRTLNERPVGTGEQAKTFMPLRVATGQAESVSATVNSIISTAQPAWITLPGGAQHSWALQLSSVLPLGTSLVTQLSRQTIDASTVTRWQQGMQNIGVQMNTLNALEQQRLVVWSVALMTRYQTPDSGVNEQNFDAILRSLYEAARSRNAAAPRQTEAPDLSQPSVVVLPPDTTASRTLDRSGFDRVIAAGRQAFDALLQRNQARFNALFPLLQSTQHELALRWAGDMDRLLWVRAQLNAFEAAQQFFRDNPQFQGGLPAWNGLSYDRKQTEEQLATLSIELKASEDSLRKTRTDVVYACGQRLRELQQHDPRELDRVMLALKAQEPELARDLFASLQAPAINTSAPNPDTASLLNNDLRTALLYAPTDHGEIEPTPRLPRLDAGGTYCAALATDTRGRQRLIVLPGPESTTDGVPAAGRVTVTPQFDLTAALHGFPPELRHSVVLMEFTVTANGALLPQRLGSRDWPKSSWAQPLSDATNRPIIGIANAVPHLFPREWVSMLAQTNYINYVAHYTEHERDYIALFALQGLMRCYGADQTLAILSVLSGPVSSRDGGAFAFARDRFVQGIWNELPVGFRRELTDAVFKLISLDAKLNDDEARVAWEVLNNLLLGNRSTVSARQSLILNMGEAKLLEVESGLLGKLKQHARVSDYEGLARWFRNIVGEQFVP